MARSILVTETFIQATRSRIGTADNNSALTLMSTDVERIKMGFRALHQVWAGMIQAALAAWMLYNRLGVAFVAPLATVTVCFVGVGILINFTGDSQRSWMAGVQKRVGLTATVIAGMKNLKISGLSVAISDFVQNLRVEELAAGARFRKVTIIAALFAFSAQLLSPPLTFAFAQQAPQDVSNLFASLSFLTLLTTPLSQIFQAIPELASGLACLGRIQAFLERERRQDFRKVYADLETNVENTRKARLDNPESAYAIVVKDGKFGWEADKFVLGDINTQVSESSLTAVIGPVGSGKSTFSKALLGEIPFNEGGVVLGAWFSRIGFCDQTPFLFNGSIRDNIVGFSSFDDERYAEVVDATCLRSDLAMLPQGDKTNTGSDGIALSGGQKQRISLARALYLQSDLLVLDDIFSGLDADTEEKVFQNIFGAGGVLRRRRTTVVLCTHSIKHLPSVDYIIALGGGTIVEQGTFGQLMSRSQGYVQCLGLVGSSSHSEGSSSEKRPEGSMLESATQLAPSSSIEVTALAPDTSESRQVGDRTVYKHYAESMGWLLAACSLLFAALWGFFTNFPTICASTSKVLCSVWHCEIDGWQGLRTGRMTRPWNIQGTLSPIIWVSTPCSRSAP
jgi:ABC-type multidrug transport system fused ATPase/permease subunit